MDKLLTEIVEQGKVLGYTGADLQSFVKEQQNILRDERAAAREREKEDHELQLKLHAEKAELEKERLKQELVLKELTNAHELQVLQKQLEQKANAKSEHESDTVKAKAPKLPCFDESKDDMDSYLRRF